MFDMKNTCMKKVLMLSFLFSIPAILFAQPGFDEQVYDVAVPFDDGVGVLLAIGIGYGLLRVILYRVHKKRKKQLQMN